MKHPLQDEIDALNRLTVSRETISDIQAPKIQNCEGFLNPQRGKRKKRTKVKATISDGKKYHTKKPKSEPEKVKRNCLRCERGFTAEGRYERLCSPFCKRDNGDLGTGGGTGRWVSARN